MCRQGQKRCWPVRSTDLAVQPGDLVSLLIGPRDGNHACDLTAVDLTLAGGGREWNLAREVSPDVLAGNPHADGHGNAGVWHFYAEPDKGGSSESVIPAGSLLARWQRAASADEKQRLAQDLEALLKSGPPAAKDSPDGLLYRQLSSLRGPLVSAVRHRTCQRPETRANPLRPIDKAAIGLDAALFGKHPSGAAIDAASLCVQAPDVAGGPAAGRPGRGLRVCDRRHAGCDDRRRGKRAVAIARRSVRATPGGFARIAGRRTRRVGRAAAVSKPRSTTSASVFPPCPLLHQDRAGRRGHHAHAFLSRGRPAPPADARSRPRPPSSTGSGPSCAL